MCSFYKTILMQLVDVDIRHILLLGCNRFLTLESVSWFVLKLLWFLGFTIETLDPKYNVDDFSNYNKVTCSHTLLSFLTVLRKRTKNNIT